MLDLTNTGTDLKDTDRKGETGAAVLVKSFEEWTERGGSYRGGMRCWRG